MRLEHKSQEEVPKTWSVRRAEPDPGSLVGQAGERGLQEGHPHQKALRERMEVARQGPQPSPGLGTWWLNPGGWHRRMVQGAGFTVCLGRKVNKTWCLMGSRKEEGK